MNPTTKTQLTQALHRPLIQYLLLFLITMCVYLPTMWYTFVWDDYGMIALNRVIREWHNIPRFFTDPSTFVSDGGTDSSLFSWRPIRNVYFTITYNIHGLRPAGWHFQQVLLHCTCTLLLLAFFRAVVRYHKQTQHLTTPALIATWTLALAWAVHPANTEILGWMKAADDIIACICGLTTLLLLLPINGKPTTPRIITAAIIYPIGLLTKESLPPLAAIYPMIIITLAPTLRHTLRNRRAIIATAILGIQTLIFIIVRAQILGGSAQSSSYIAPNFSLMMATMTTAIVRYLQLTFWPFWPTTQLGNYILWPLAQSWTDPWVFRSIVIIVVAIIICAIISSRCRLFFAGCLFTVLAFLPTANILPMVQVLAERFMYFPLMGVALAAVPLLVKWFQKTTRTRIAIPAVVIAALITTAELRLPVWTDELSFEKSILEVTPNNMQALINYGTALRDHDREDESLPVLEKAIYAPEPDLKSRFVAPVLIAKTMIKREQYEKAAAYIELAMTMRPDLPQLLVYKGDILSMEGKTTAALEVYKKAESRGYDKPLIYQCLAQAYYQLGSNELAIHNARISLEKYPDMPKAREIIDNLE